MKVIICGAGQVGYGIAERLSAEGNSVSIIDASAELVQRANDMLEVRAVHGNAAHPDVLARAGAREADMLIAVTLHDEVNMVACQVAHTLFDIPMKIARVRAQTYLEREWSRLFARDAMPIDYIISPEIEVGNMILRRLQLPGAFDTVSFGDGKIAVLGIACGPDCPVLDTPLTQLAELFPDLPAVTAALVRSGRLFVPHGRDQLQAGDDAYVITPTEQVVRTLQIFGHEETRARRIVIAGGGNIGLYIARQLEEREPNVRIKMIEVSRARAVEIAEKLERTVVLHGSALSEDVLREAEIAAADTLVAVTNDDQVNLLTSALAKQLGCRSNMTLVNSSNYAGMVRSLGIDAQVSPRAITVSSVLQHVRRGRIRGVHSVHNGAGELIEAEVLETAPILGRALRDYKHSEGIRFGAILRGGKVFMPTGATELEVKDRVVLFARADHVREVEQMFRVSPDYF
ncbi:MAG: Trk system potassium transporter TrkA [Hyphomicrobiaceae bacterium]|nr:Trk system potassium transporter TrkA [Hyphomicrobiaceae bacterium]